ncbi:hypothetical protein [Agromyces sp. SYSU T00266]|uniref:hypothetical protein n=1 Tax=Agromyces zhanjiangensis TaxID=3158562 RepID=UPI0033999517
MEVRRAILSPNVIALVVLGVLGLVVLWVMTSWLVELDSGAIFDDTDRDAQRRYYLMSTLPYMLSGAAVSALLASLLGLPLLIGARLVAIRQEPTATSTSP